MRIILDHINRCSLDAPVVGTLWFALFSQKYPIEHQSIIRWMMFSVIWMVYSLDRMLETDHSRLKERHLFHKHVKRILIPLIIALFLINAGMVVAVQFNENIKAIGLVIAATTAIYLLIASGLPFGNRVEWIKNMLTALIFVSAISIPSWYHLAGVSRSQITEISLLYVLVLSNLRILGALENKSTVFRKYSYTLTAILFFSGALIFPTKITITWLVSYCLMILFHLKKWDRKYINIHDPILIATATASLLI